MVALSLFALVAIAACGGGEEAPPPPAADESSVRTFSGREAVGFRTPDDAHAWLGIPFAEPPVGDLRWRAPRRAEAWPGRLEALAHGSACAQFAGPGGGRDGAAPGEVTGSEDCLYLNVYAPRFAPDAVPRGAESLPVMFWIHGGGNSVGDAIPYDGSRLAVRQGLIVVTVHYRVGVFGWFSHPALSAPDASAEDRSGNYGTLDLVAALEWVQRNIEAFGGDPGRVTIFGESAGGTNVFSLLLSPRAKGLFHRAISQSGGAWTYSMTEAQNLVDDPDPGRELSSGEILLKLLVRDGLATDREEAKQKLGVMQRGEVANTLRSKSTAEMMAIFEGGAFGGMYSIPALLRDGVVLSRERPDEAFERATGYNQVPTILGSNRDEDKLFLLFSAPSVTKAFGLPLWVNDQELYDASAEYQSLMWKARGVDEPAAAMRATQGPSVYGYRFDWDDEPKLLWADFSKMLGAAHALEIPFVFGTLDLGLGNPFVFDPDNRAGDEELAARMMSYWAEFAYSGEPGRGRDGTLPHWQPWAAAGSDAGRFMLLDSEQGGGLRMSSRIVTPKEVIALVADDPRFPSWSDRCRVYRSFVEWGETMDEREYAHVGDGACRAHPLANP